MSKIRILLVDDDTSLLQMLEDGIGTFCADCQVTSATDGLIALEQLRLQPFDLVLTDYHMPGLTGLELAQNVRQALPHTRVVLMTAYGDGVAFKQRIRALELEHYLAKPFSLKQVREIIEETSAAVTQGSNHAYHRTDEQDPAHRDPHAPAG
jgi:CheY-like chemotaxis protein